MKLSIIILSYNTKDLTITCISSIIRQYKEQLEKGEFEIIVVDNASSDASASEISNSIRSASLRLRGRSDSRSSGQESQIPNLKLIKNEKNFGFSKGNNIGASKAKGQYLLFLNSDTEILDKGLLKVVDFIENDDAGILGLRLKNPDGSIQASCGNFYNFLNVLIMLFGGERIGLLRSSPTKVKEVDWVSGASLLVKKDLFTKLKGFDENLFMYMEDMELCYRVKKEGFLVKFFPDIEITHTERGSSDKSFAISNIYRGLLYFYKKHKSFWQFTLVKIFLILKARIAILIGKLLGRQSLVITYKKALEYTI